MKNHFPPKKILVAVDDTPPSWSAFAAAKALAARLGAALEAVYIEPLLPAAEFEPALHRAQQVQQGLRAEIKSKAGDVALRVIRGQPITELVRLAAPRTAQLMIMGTHGRGGGERFLFGSTAEAVFHRARIPVLAVHDGAVPEIRRILVPCNLESYADDALRYSRALGRALGAEVTVLYVCAKAGADERLRRHLEDALGVPESRDVQRVTRSGEPREQIALAARSERYDLVVLSGHKRAQLSDLALGTTAERLLRVCRVPLLAVPAEGAARVRYAKPAAGLVWK